MIKKILALVLAILMVLAVFVGCGKKKTNVDDETSGKEIAETTTADIEDDEDDDDDDNGDEFETNPDFTKDGEVNDTADADDWSVEDILNPDNWEGADIPDNVDYGGYKFNLLADTSNNLSKCEFVAESDGDVVKDAVVARMDYIEGYVGVDFNVTEYDGGYGNMEGFAAEIQNASGAGNPFDLACAYNLIPPIVAAKGLSKDLAASKNLNLLETKKPYWGSGIKEEIMIGGRIFWMSDNASWTSIRGMTCIFVNKELFAAHNKGKSAEDLYELVDKKQWTMANMLTLIQGSYKNTNVGDEKIDGKDEGDTFGLAASQNMARVDLWLYSAGLRYTKLNAKGTYDWTLADATHTEMITWWHETLHSSDDFIQSGEYKITTDGRAIFAHAPILVTEEKLEYEYTVLPMPFYNSAIKNNYSTAICNVYGSYLIPKATSAEAFERSATVLELLAAEGNRRIAPAYFEIYLKRNQAANDPDMMRMFNVIRNSVVFDVGYLYGSSLTVENLNSEGTYDEVFLALRRLWSSANSKNYTNISTIWAKIGTSATTKLNNLMVDILDY